MTLFMRIAAGMVAGLICSFPAHATPIDLADSVDAAVVKWMSAYGIANAEVAVGAHGTVIKSYAHGWSPTDLHSIGSLSKGITGLCVSRLLDNGQLHLDDTIGGALSGYFATNGKPAPVDTRFKTITVEQLLTHRAGLRKNAFDPETDKSIADSFRSAETFKLLSAPGTTISYSNSGYLILGFIAQTVGGESYSSLCGADIKALTGGSVGNIEPSLNYRAPNGGWNESAVNYVKLLAFLDPQSQHYLGQSSRKWLDGLAGAAGYAASDNGTDLPPCNLFTGTPAYGFGACSQRTTRGTLYYHDGAVASKTPGGSMFFVNEAGYEAVVIFDAEKDYRQLFTALSGALTTPAAYLPYSTTSANTGGNDGNSGSNPCEEGSGAFLKQTHTNRQAEPTLSHGSKLHPCNHR